jgi:hypothetical protein
MNWMVVALLLNGSGGISGSIDTRIEFRTADECIENLMPISKKFSAVAELALRKTGTAKRGDPAPRYYRNIQWVCFPTKSQEPTSKQ